jgi:polyhydroxybutyrate depolymerase
MPDVVFISRLIDTLEASYHIDPTRIYANGMSNGGGMAFVLSCTLPERIAAVGLVSPGLYPASDWCKDPRPLPVIAFHGTADPIAPYNGGMPRFGDETLPSVPGFMADWARRNRCGSTPTVAAIAADVTRLQYSGCAEDAAVVLYTLHGEGHQWPGGKRIAEPWLVGPYSDSLDATRQMWAFFVAHPLPRN